MGLPDPGMTRTYEKCLERLLVLGLPISAPASSEKNWCNATFDTVLCWPATEGNRSAEQRCPPMKGLDPDMYVTKECHASGRWRGKNDSDWSMGGWTNYYPCMILDPEAAQKAQHIGRIVRYVEFVGLFLSLVSLVLALIIFCGVRRLQVFRVQLHRQLIGSILMVTIIRLILYIDGEYTQSLGTLAPTDIGLSINTSRYICEGFYVLLEYAKTVAYAWMILEGFYLFNSIVISVFASEPKLYIYCLVGWGVPLIHVAIWFCVIVLKRTLDNKEVEKCLGAYYLHPEFWILDTVRLLELGANIVFLLIIIRVLWIKVSQTTATEAEYLRKSVKAAFMLIPLLGIPNILQLIPLRPTKDNIFWWAVYTFVATLFYMYQGLFIAILYCFTNREVISILKSQYERFRIRHASVEFLRRGSRAPPSMYAQIVSQQQQNGFVTDHTCAETVHLAPAYPSTYKTSNGSVAMEPYPRQPPMGTERMSQLNPTYVASLVTLSVASPAKELPVTVTESTSLLPPSRPLSQNNFRAELYAPTGGRTVEDSEDEIAPPSYAEAVGVHRSSR